MLKSRKNVYKINFRLQKCKCNWNIIIVLVTKYMHTISLTLSWKLSTKSLMRNNNLWIFLKRRANWFAFVSRSIDHNCYLLWLQTVYTGMKRLRFYGVKEQVSNFSRNNIINNCLHWYLPRCKWPFGFWCHNV